MTKIDIQFREAETERERVRKLRALVEEVGRGRTSSTAAAAPGAEGPQGPRGFTGETGPTGPTGPSGADSFMFFDGGTPFSDYTDGPGLDCGGVT